MNGLMRIRAGSSRSSVNDMREAKAIGGQQTVVVGGLEVITVRQIVSPQDRTQRDRVFDAVKRCRFWDYRRMLPSRRSSRPSESWSRSITLTLVDRRMPSAESMTLTSC